MKYLLSVILTLFCFSVIAQESGIRGIIRDIENQPLPFASLFVNENGAGAVTNEEGLYELRLAPGTYTVVIQYLGYQTKVETLTIGNGFKNFDASLKPQTFTLKEVEVQSDGEDPAYTVMRRAIAKAEYHRQQLDAYSAQVYIKGAGRLLKSPRVVRKFIEKEGIDSTVAFTSETVSDISYTRPNTYTETVRSIYTQGDERSTSPMRFINGSFYEDDIAGAISPLSKKAFGYYRFKLAGYFEDQGYLVNKIQVTPRSKGDKVFEGYIYIIEDLWSIHSLELTTYQVGFRFDINTLFNPIESKVWMPIRYTFDVTGSFFGFAFEYEYLTTVDQYKITLNPDLPVELNIVDEKINREMASVLKQQRKENPEQASSIEKLSQGEELTRKEMRKLMREYVKEERLEAETELEVEINTSLEIDSNAYQQDSAFWAAVRPIPLTRYEVRGYELQDSLEKVEEVEAQAEEEGNPRSGGSFSAFDILLGKRFKLSEKTYLLYKSPILDLQFNPVEGINGTSWLSYQIRNDSFDFDLGTELRYGNRWKRGNFKVYSEIEFGDRKQNQIEVSGGRYVEQYNRDQAVSELFNTFQILLTRNNYVHMFEKEYGRIAFTRNWSVEGSFYVNAEWANRRYISDFFAPKWIPDDTDADPTPNWPEVADATYPFPNREKAFVLESGFEVRPWQKYRIRNGEKYPIRNSSPTLGMSLRVGLPKVFESTTDFSLLEGNFKHKLDIGYRGILDIRVNAGVFLNSNQINLVDFKHFPGNQMSLTGIDPVQSYRLLPFYTFSTRQEFVSVYTHYQFRKFLLTQIWEVNLLGIKENVFSNYLYTPNSDNYFEVGYGLDNIFRLFRIEVVTSFRDGTYDDIGFRIGIASNIGGGLISIN